jgi:hypothetical protein
MAAKTAVADSVLNEGAQENFGSAGIETVEPMQKRFL